MSFLNSSYNFTPQTRLASAAAFCNDNYLVALRSSIC